MATPIRELKKEILDDSIPLSNMLRKAVLIAKNINDPENEKWIRAELVGYQDGEEPPDYRILGGQPVLFNHFVGWEILLFNVADPEITRLLTSMPMLGPISEIEDFANQEELKLHYGNNFEKYIVERINKDGKPAISIAGTQFKTLLTTVRNKLFNWVSDLPDEKVSISTQKERDESMVTEKTWKDSVENHPLRYALLIVIATALIVASIMGWIQKVREDDLTTRYEIEKQGMKNDYEAQIRELKAKVDFLQVSAPTKIPGKP